LPSFAAGKASLRVFIVDSAYPQLPRRFDSFSYLRMSHRSINGANNYKCTRLSSMKWGRLESALGFVCVEYSFIARQLNG